MKSIKEILEEAGRHKDIMNILIRIIDSTDYDFPVDCFENDGIPCYTVNGEYVREEAIFLFYLFETGKTEKDIARHKFDNLCQLIHSDCDTYIHNIGVDITHRKNLSLEDEYIEKARSYCILENFLLCYGNDVDPEGNPVSWDIPDGWKKKE